MSRFLQKTQSVLLHYDGYVIRGKVIYTTHKHDTNDIAVIVSEQHKVNIIPCEISNNITSIGKNSVFYNLLVYNNISIILQFFYRTKGVCSWIHMCK